MLVTQQVQGHLAMMWMSAVLEQVDTLPGAERWSSTLHWNCQLGLCQGRLDMRRHVVRAFGRVSVWPVLRCNTGKKGLQVMTYIGIGVFLDGLRGRSVTDKKRQQTLFDFLLVAPVHHIRSDVVQPRTTCFRTQCVHCLPHAGRLTNEEPQENLKDENPGYAATDSDRRTA